MMGLSYLRFTAALCVLAVCLLVGSAEGGKPTCLDKLPMESPRQKRMAENVTTSTSVSDKKDPAQVKICYRGDPCCFSCSYDSSQEDLVKGFDLVKSSTDNDSEDTNIFECDEEYGPQSDNSTYTFDVERQELCLKGLVHDSGRYVCKMNYADLHLHSTLTVTDVTMADKLGTPTVTVEKTGPVKEGETVNLTCSLDNKGPTSNSINVTWYNGTNTLYTSTSELTPKIVGNSVTFRMKYTVTWFDNGKEISCQVTYGGQTKTSLPVPLDVQYYPRMECKPTAQLVVGRPAKVICTIDANPEVPLNIVFPDELIETGWEPNGSTLSTRELKPPCSKTVTITATNNVGMGEASLLMDCWFEATISAKFNRSDNIFCCKAEGNPVPEISWDLLYENNTIQSYNSTASTLELSKRELQGVKAVTCRADQRQRRYFLPTNHQFTLEQNRSCDCGWNPMIPLVFVAIVAVILAVVGYILGYFQCHIYVCNCLKKCLSRQEVQEVQQYWELPQGVPLQM